MLLDEKWAISQGITALIPKVNLCDIFLNIFKK